MISVICEHLQRLEYKPPKVGIDMVQGQFSKSGRFSVFCHGPLDGQDNLKLQGFSKRVTVIDNRIAIGCCSCNGSCPALRRIPTQS